MIVPLKHSRALFGDFMKIPSLQAMHLKDLLKNKSEGLGKHHEYMKSELD